MSPDPNALPVDTARPAPKLLLDTNVYLDLADGHLPAEGERLKVVAAHRDPPLLWSCQIVLDELICRTCQGPEDFLRHQAALRWMDSLCGVLGTGEPLWWVLRRAVFASDGPKDTEATEILVKVRRAVLRAETYDQVPDGIRAGIEGLAAHYGERIDAWVESRTKLNAAAREKVKPGERGVRDTVVATDTVLQIARKYTEGDIPEWGPMRDPADQKHAQREQIAFEVSLLRKAQNPGGYNHAKWRGDYNDYWLCAYPAAGYTIVTRERRLRDALKQGECVDARVVTLEEGIAIAEDWLARRR